MAPHENDPLWKMRHALLGLLLALAVSVPLAAWLGATIADRFDDSYGLRAGVYAGLLAYVVIGAGVLFAKVARHETRPLTARRFGLWLASLWLWPLLVLRRQGPGSRSRGAPTDV